MAVALLFRGGEFFLDHDLVFLAEATVAALFAIGCDLLFMRFHLFIDVLAALIDGINFGVECVDAVAKRLLRWPKTSTTAARA